jgi:hypothetical protein
VNHTSPTFENRLNDFWTVRASLNTWLKPCVNEKEARDLTATFEVKPSGLVRFFIRSNGARDVVAVEI